MMDSLALTSSGLHASPQTPAMSPDPPIDPALVIDPAILGEPSEPQQVILAQPSSSSLFPGSSAKFQFEQGPQGDPFAPQPDESYFQPRLPSPSRPLKRKRRIRPAARRDEECSFCQGDDGRNKFEQPEEMVSCVACGRSGHPSCLGIAGIADVLRSYPWHCIECKICEVCDKKGNGNRMLFCDACDRGWHMDCLDPPLDSTPDGSWICPLCSSSSPPLLPPHEGIPILSLSPCPASPSTAPPVASSSCLLQQRDSTSRTCSTGNVQPNAYDKTEVDGDGDEPARMRYKTESDARAGNKGRGKTKGKGRAVADVRGKGKGRTSQALDDPSSTLRAHPKLRISMGVHEQSSGLPVATARKVRLVVRKPKAVRHEEEGADDDGSPSHMFDGILQPEEYSTANTNVTDFDKSLFNRSRTRAEMKLGPPVGPPPLPSALLTPGPGTPSTPGPSAGPSAVPTLVHALRTRHAIAQALHFNGVTDTQTPPGTPNPASQMDGTSHPPRIRTIRFGEYDVDTWYDAPFPEEYASVADGKLWICEFCLKYMKSRFQSTRHRMKCKARHPPGDEIYRGGSISVFEVDGRKNKIYCQNLCLLSKMFLDHKSLFYDVEPFLFYVMTEVDRLGARFVGYFSKEKRSPKDYNVSCIMTLPVRQRKGWGSILIDFSYLLSKREERVGSPERPLSALGALAYKQYWTHTIKTFLSTAQDPVTLEDISRATAMTLEDIYNTLLDLNYITVKERTPPPPPRPPPGTPIKYLRGRKNGPGITRRALTRTNTKDDTKGPLTIPTQYTIRWNRGELDAYMAAWRAKEHVTIEPRCLKWSPFLLSRARKSETIPIVGTRDEQQGGEATPMEVDRSSASSTKATQSAPHDIHDSTLKLAGERSPMESMHDVDMQASSFSVEAEESKPSIQESAFEWFGQVSTKPASVEPTRSESPRHSSRARSTSLRGLSIQRSTPTLENARLKTLRSRASVSDKRTRNTDDDGEEGEEEEEEESVNGAGNEVDVSRDSVIAAMLAHEERPRRTRSTSYRIDHSKAISPRPSPRKRRRVESSPSAGSDADCSLSELTHGSTSPSPSPPPRRITRSVNGRSKPRAHNGTNSAAPKNILTRATRRDAPPLTLGVRLSSRINGATHAPSPVEAVVKEYSGVEDSSNIRTTRSARRAKADPTHKDTNGVSPLSADDHRNITAQLRLEGKLGNQEVMEKGLPAGLPKSLIRAAQSIIVEGVDGENPGMYDDDALGEEDAEGEEDPNPSDTER